MSLTLDDFGTLPEGPRASFGPKMAWLSTRAPPQATYDALARCVGSSPDPFSREPAPRPLIAGARLAVRRTASWEEGIGVVCAREQVDAIFLAAPIAGWTVVVGWALTGVDPRRLGELGALLGAEAQLFATHRVVEAHQWAKAQGGTLHRAYAFVGESGVVLDEGARTPEELRLGVGLPEGEAVLDAPDEDDVCVLAGLWSVDPSRLDERPGGSGGWLLRLIPQAK